MHNKFILLALFSFLALSSAQAQANDLYKCLKALQGRDGYLHIGAVGVSSVFLHAGKAYKIDDGDFHMGHHGAAANHCVEIAKSTFWIDCSYPRKSGQPQCYLNGEKKEKCTSEFRAGYKVISSSSSDSLDIDPIYYTLIKMKNRTSELSKEELLKMKKGIEEAEPICKDLLGNTELKKVRGLQFSHLKESIERRVNAEGKVQTSPAAAPAAENSHSLPAAR